MIRYLLHKIFYGLLVLFGAVTVVFFLFNLAPGDPVRNLVGENASEDIVHDLRRKLDLDLPLGTRYLLYLNDLSPLSVHNPRDTESRIYLDSVEYSSTTILAFGESRCLVLKFPYLKRSFLSDKSVSRILGEVIPGTILLAVVSISLSLIAGLALGMAAGVWKDSAFDRMILLVSAIGMAGPSFFVAILVAWVGAILWYDSVFIPLLPLVFLLTGILVAVTQRKRKILPSVKASSAFFWGVGLALFVFITGRLFFSTNAFINSGIRLPGTGLQMTGSLYAEDVWKGQYIEWRNMILPVITLMIRPLAVIVQLTRSSLIDVMGQDYIRTAKAKGLSQGQIVWRHALRNALNPVVTAVSGWFASLLAGAVFVEFVFGWKGLGQEMFNAIEKQDLPVVMGGVIAISCFFVVINLLVDLIYGWIDPRIRMN